MIVEGRLWGMLGFAWHDESPQLSNLESRMTGFTELAATAIANAHSRAELAASRARLVVAADETRRRIERDLHDGTQQRLVSLALSLRAAGAGVPEQLVDLRRQLSEAERGIEAALEELQEISRGIHPAILTRGGLAPALRALGRRSVLPVELQVELSERLPAPIEVAAYYIVSEALTNATKHAHAQQAVVRISAGGTIVDIVVSDDGIGGAEPERGSGLLGLRDRVETLGGTLTLTGEPGEGTTLHATIPLTGRPATSLREADVLTAGRRDQATPQRRR